MTLLVKQRPGYLRRNDLPETAQRETFGRPPVNIIEGADAFEIQMIAPGREKEDFKIEIEKDHLIITAAKPEMKGDPSFRLHEFELGSLRRSFSLPKTLDLTSIRASYDKGILTLHLPKLPEAVKVVKEITVN